ncbi:MAG: ABC transporter permease, partial [Flammeovirgaceae bacterium]
VNANNSASIVSVIKEDFPEIESTVRILNHAHFVDGQTPLNHGDKIGITISSKPGIVFKEERVVYADSNLFTFFTLPLVYGNPADVLKDAGSVVLSQSTSKKYFGEIDPRGELIKLNDSITLKVSGVYTDVPHNSHLIFDMVISDANYVNKWQVDRASIVFYEKFIKETDLKTFEAKLNKNVKKYFAEAYRIFPNLTVELYVQPLVEIPFGEISEDVFPSKSKPFLTSLAFIAVSVLVMAWINYINLSVVRLKHRFKEVATRKVSGGSTLDMAKQFLTEAFVINTIALLLAITIVHLTQVPVSFFFDIPAESYHAPDLYSIACLVTVFICGVLISGLYPSLISGRLSPRAIFDERRQSSSAGIVTSSLTITQISLAIVFILFGFVIASQLSYILSLNTGINKNEVIVVDAPVIKPTNYSSIVNTFTTQLLNVNKNFEDASLSSSLFDVGNHSCPTKILKGCPF